MNTRKSDGPLLELIPKEQLSPQQNAFKLRHYARDNVPLYKLRQEPTHLNDVDWQCNIAIWRDNGTIICVGFHSYQQYDERYVTFMLQGQVNLNCTIFGKTDAAIAETTFFFASLKHPEHADALLQVDVYSQSVFDERKIMFNFATLPAEQLAQILDANPTRRLCLSTSVLTAEQGVVLATRPYSVHLKLTGAREDLGFTDGGKAFVDALEKRQTLFGSLEISCNKDKMPFSRSNLERMLELDNIIETLKIPLLENELSLLPLAAKVSALDYKIISTHMQPEDFDSLNLATTDLYLEIEDRSDKWSAKLVAFLSRVAEWGHFERLSFSFHVPLQKKSIQAVLQALVNAMACNAKLTYLNLNEVQYLFDERFHFENIFQAMEEHRGLRTVVLDHYPPECLRDENDDDSDDSDAPLKGDYSLLERLLSRNRNIAVCNCYGRITNRSSIDKLYALNSLYNGSANLVKEPPSLRPLLVATALTESALGNFQHTSLLLSNHADMLCELIQGVNIMNDLVTAGLEMGVAVTSATVAAAQSQTTERP